MKRTLPAALITATFIVAGSTNAATLVSSALDNEDTDIAGSLGIFAGTPGDDTAPEIAGVTTTVISNPGNLNGKFASGTTGPKTTTLRAVSAANGMDLTYDVTFSPFRYDAVNGDVAASSRINSGRATVSSDFTNPNRGQSTADGAGVEFWRVTIDNVVNSGATDFNMDGAVTIRTQNLAGLSIQSSYVGGVSGAVLGSDGTGTVAGTNGSNKTDIALSSPSTSFAIVATSSDAANNFENRWEGIAVQFTAVPEPGSLALLGLGGLLVLRRKASQAASHRQA